MLNTNIFGQDPHWKTHKCSDITPELISKTVILGGWVHFLRDKGKLIFLHLRDGSGICQVIFKKEITSEEVFSLGQGLTLESVITIRGQVIEEPRSIRGVDIIAEKIIIHSLASPKIPIDITTAKTKFDSDTEFKYRELSIRTMKVHAIMEIKAEIAYAVRNFYRNQGFIEIHTPYILMSATEGGAEKFSVDYFGQPSVLAQSCQFYKQAAIAIHEKVFGIIPSWRAEKSRTPKHLVEFHQIENEIAFGTHETIKEVQENLIHSVVKHIKENCQEQLKELGRENLRVPKLPFKRLTFEEAKDLLEKKLNITEPREEDFSTPAETALSKYHKDPFFITQFPVLLRGIYYEKDPNDETLTNSLDLVAPEGYGELSSGGQRVFSKDRLVERIKKKGMNPENFDWYLRMFEYGMPPHAGFGLGFERLVRWICGLAHVREAVLFPRTPDIVQP